MSDFDSSVTYLPIPGYPGYRAGDDGSIWSCKSNSGKLTDRWKRLSPAVHKKTGYLRVCVTPATGKPQTAWVSRLVLAAFVGPCPAGMEACHENDKRNDNRPSNLKWDTRQNNIAQRDQRDRQASGERCGSAKLKESDIPNVFVLSALGFSQRRIAGMMGVSRGPIFEILNGKKWRHVTRNKYGSSLP